MKVLRAVSPLESSRVVLGQFGGYRDVQGVAPDSRVETFAAIRLEVRTWRWEGVPFYLRAGKCLPESCTEVFVTFRKPMAVYGETSRPNHLRFRLSPRIEIGLGVQIVGPEEDLTGKSVELQVGPQEIPGEILHYERLLDEAIKGDQSLFAREDTVELAWKIVDPALVGSLPVHVYEKGSWGPQESASILHGGDRWHDPVVI